MTPDQFQTETHEYMTASEQAARNKAAEYNAKGVDGETVVAVQFGGLWCVMLGSAAEFVRELGI